MPRAAGAASGRMWSPASPPGTIRSLFHGLKVLDLVAEHGPALSLTEIGERGGMDDVARNQG